MTSLSTYFKGTASKYLSAVDATPKSNQHEIGSNKFTAILGNPGTEKLRFPATFLFFPEDSDIPESCTDVVTYYDTRLSKPNRSAEYRLYYRDNSVTRQFAQGDFCVVGALTNGELMIATARPSTPQERRLRFLFDAHSASENWYVESEISTTDLDIASRSILEAIGIELLDSADEMLDKIVARFGLRFPSTKDFSAFARATLGQHPSPTESPDVALEEWMKQEERLFRSLEKTIIEKRLASGFTNTEDFISFSLSVQNRRKSRVGHALENHVEAILKALNIPFERGVRTEGNAKPDFLFPSAHAYHDSQFDASRLYMLAAKTTCKDRWRQILTEAHRIPHKHLITLETAISQNQTDEMRVHSVQLIAPASVKATFTEDQRDWIIGVADFLELVKQT